MPLPERYEPVVRDMVAVWKPEGTFRAQGRIWIAQSEARHEMFGSPTLDQVGRIKEALVLSPEDIAYLNTPEGHETNKYLRLVQPRLDPETGNFLHLGNTSSDILDTALALQMVESLMILDADMADLEAATLAMSLHHRLTLTIARSHGQQAIPHTWGRKTVGWYAEMLRGRSRIARAKDVIAFGKLSGEVGTNQNISPELEELSLAKLGLEPDPAPTQVISRDRHAEALNLIAVNGAILERFATNVALLSRNETGEVREPFDRAAQQGSSSMPQKRNPEISERIRGLNRIIRHAAAAELESAVLWDERDISHSSTERFVMPDIFGCLAYATRLSTWMMRGLEVDTERMLANMDVTHGAIYGSRVLNTILPMNKLPRTEAYDLVKKLALRAMDEKTPMQTLVSQNEQLRELLRPDEVEELFQPGFYLRNIDTAYKRLGINLEDAA